MLNQAKIKDENYFLINLSGPNNDAEAVRFYQDLSITLRGLDCDSDNDSNVVILGGDFELALRLADFWLFQVWTSIVS